MKKKSLALSLYQKKLSQHILGQLNMSAYTWDLLPAAYTPALHVSGQVTYSPVPILMAVQLHGLCAYKLTFHSRSVNF